MVLLTEQDFKDLEQVATDGIKVYYRLTQSLTTDDCDPLEDMLDRLNRSCNKLVNRFTQLKDYFALISNDRVQAGKATAATAHHLAYDLVYDLHMTVGYKLNPDDDNWKNNNPNDLRIENLPQYREQVIKVVKFFADNMRINGVYQYELIDRLDSERVKAWNECQQQQAQQQQQQSVAKKPAGSTEKPTEICKYSTDFASVVWFGESYTFTSTQAACVKVLWIAWENGTPEIGEQTILGEAGSESNQLMPLFNNGKHPAWITMIHRGSTKGRFKLAKPE